MDPAKVEFLFGRVPTWADLDDPDDRSALLREQGFRREDAVGRFGLAMYEAIADQITSGEPPEVWQTARRLLEMGLDRRRVLHHLALTINAEIQSALASDRRFDLESYVAALGRLPLPTGAEIEDAMVSIVRDGQPVSVEELESRVMAELDMPRETEPFETLMDFVSDRAMDPDGPLALLAGDLVVHPESLLREIVLTHRLTEEERAADRLEIGVDLVGSWRWDGPLKTPAGEELQIAVLDDRTPAWQGPDGWLRGFEPGWPLSVRAADGVLVVEALHEEPEIDPSLVARVRSAYDAEMEEPGLPVSAEDILLGLLTHDAREFSVPGPPLSELCAAASLEIRGDELAHEEAIWINQRHAQRVVRIVDRLEDRDDSDASLRILEAFDEGTDDPARLRVCLSGLRAPDVLDAVLDEMLGFDEDPGAVDRTAAFAEALLAAARRPSEIAVARMVATVACERRRDPLTAEAYLRFAVEADGGWGPAVDRLAWYGSDRGDAGEATRLWRSLGLGPDDNDDLREVEPFARPSEPKLGRNERCWCGSGRKYKVCHLGRPVVPPLPDRVGWLCRKAAAYLERRGGRAVPDVFELASTRAGDDADEDDLSRAMDDPLVIDVALHELGWFDRFLAERGPLLPEDEALLAASWSLVDRTVYEVVGTDPGVGLMVQDLRSAERLRVRERTFSGRARSGMLVCGRAVPDGETHQFVGALFTVTPGTEADLLDLLDGRDAFELMEHLAALERPPVLTTREGEPLVVCSLTLEVPDPDAARTALDRLYRRDNADMWVEAHTLDNGDEILRATLRLEGSRLDVDAMSEARIDRARSALMDAIEGARTVSEDRRAHDPRRGPPPGPVSQAPSPDDPAVRAAMDKWIDKMERRWCEEPVPALSGLTPRQAAADPTRRETLERLLASFEDRSGLVPEGAITMTMRPARLRVLLGLAHES
ncbi:MAG: YecA family protein [Actinomycetota bacterium]